MTKEKSIWIEKFPVLELDWFNKSYFKIRLLAPEIAETAVAGQFVQVRVTETFDPLLRRPFSIARRDASDGWIELVVKVVGKATHLLGTVKPGTLIDILGPLGRGFDLSTIDEAVIVGGGIGIAPLLFLAQEMQEMNMPVLFIQGFRDKDELCCLDELKTIADELVFTTEDGSAGQPGLVTSALQKTLENRSALTSRTLFACGPEAMLRSVSQIADRFEMNWQFSFETRMACGTGACMGCAIPTFDGEHYRLVCKDGPVFKKHEVLV